MDNALKQWKKTGLYFLYQGHKIFYQYSDTKDHKTQEKPCLVCIHGFPTSSWDWRRIWPELTKHYQIIAPDLLGFGFSDKPSHYAITEQADMITSLLNELEISKYHILAHDFGTLVAQELLARFTSKTPSQQQPQLMSIFAISSSIFPELSNPRLIQQLLISPIGFLISLLFNQKKFNRSLRNVFAERHVPDAATLSAYWQLLSLQHGHKQLHKLNFFLKDRKVHGKRWASAWQNSPIPIRYLAGEDDPMYGKEVLQSLKAISSHQDIHSIQSAGHFPHIETPEEVLQRLSEFREKCPL